MIISLARQLIQDSARTSLHSTSCWHQCQLNCEAGCSTISLSHCFMIASFRERLGGKLATHQHHGRVPSSILVSSQHERKVLCHGSDSALTAEMFWGSFGDPSVLPLYHTQRVELGVPICLLDETQTIEEIFNDSCPCSSLVPRPRKRAWYLLFAHAQTPHFFVGHRKL